MVGRRRIDVGDMPTHPLISPSAPARPPRPVVYPRAVGSGSHPTMSQEITGEPQPPRNFAPKERIDNTEAEAMALANSMGLSGGSSWIRKLLGLKSNKVVPLKSKKETKSRVSMTDFIPAAPPSRVGRPPPSVGKVKHEIGTQSDVSGDIYDPNQLIDFMRKATKMGVELGLGIGFDRAVKTLLDEFQNRGSVSATTIGQVVRILRGENTPAERERMVQSFVASRSRNPRMM